MGENLRIGRNKEEKWARFGKKTPGGGGRLIEANRHMWTGVKHGTGMSTGGFIINPGKTLLLKLPPFSRREDFGMFGERELMDCLLGGGSDPNDFGKAARGFTRR